MGEIIGVRAHLLYRWYRNTLSNYQKEIKDNSFHKYDIEVVDKTTGEIEYQPVPILKQENMGEDMAVDEKQIDGEMYTILSNRKSGKIALMANTMKVKELAKLTSHFGQSNWDVTSVTCDLSPTYDWYIRESFLKAIRIADKFHIVKLLLEHVQDHRIRLKHEYLSSWRKQCELEKKKLPHQRHVNGETTAELLSRSRYLLFKMPYQWSVNQKERAQILFDKYPKLETDYQLQTSFREWYEGKNIGQPISTLKANLREWITLVEHKGSDELKNFLVSLNANEGKIVNYFIDGKTNAQAENLNSRLQSFIRSNKGIRDNDFFLWRCKQYFS